MNKSTQIIALIITLIISIMSFLFVYDTLSRFGFIFIDILNNFYRTPVIHFFYSILILLLSIPALRFNLMLVQKRSFKTNKNINKELLDNGKNESEENRTFKKAWKLYYLFSLIFLLHPIMFILIVFDQSITLNHPIGMIIFILINILLGVFLFMNTRKTKEMKWL